MTYMDHTLDHIGPITTTVADNALMLEVMAGHDWRDPQWVRATPSRGSVLGGGRGSPSGLRIGIIGESLEPVGCSADVLEAFEGAKEQLTGLGATISSVSVPLWPDSMAIAMGDHQLRPRTRWSRPAARASATSVGSTSKSWRPTSPRRASAPQDLPPMLKSSLITAEYLRDAYLGVHFGRAQNLRLELRRQVEVAMADVDVLIMPDHDQGRLRAPRRTRRPRRDGGTQRP